jgi:hypothetical protein
VGSHHRPTSGYIGQAKSVLSQMILPSLGVSCLLRAFVSLQFAR